MSDGASSHTGGKPSLAVVVVNWNGCDLLDDCLGSLHADDLDLRVIMVDNGSHDDSVAHCREHHPQVDIIESPENLRWAGGNNLALRQLLQEGVPDGVLLLNNDTIVCKGALSRLMNVLTESGNWAATPRICYADSPEILWYEGGQVGRWTGWVSHRGIRKRAVDYPVERSATEYGTGCALLLSRHALEVVGLLDEDYFLYGEDTDYSLRLRQAGGTIVHEPAAVVLHKVSRTTGADSPRKAYMKSRSHMMLLRRHWSRSLWPVLIPSQIAFLGAQSLWQLFHGRAQTALAGVVGALDELSGRDDPS